MLNRAMSVGALIVMTISCAPAEPVMVSVIPEGPDAVFVFFNTDVTQNEVNAYLDEQVYVLVAESEYGFKPQSTGLAAIGVGKYKGCALLLSARLNTASRPNVVQRLRRHRFVAAVFTATSVQEITESEIESQARVDSEF